MPFKKYTASLLIAVCAIVTAPAHADVRAGVDAWSQGNFDAAIAEWRGPAVAGDADAQFNMGQAYKLGRGVPQDLAIAEDWFKRAADQGHLQAEDNYGLLLFQSGRRSEAVRFLTRSAMRGEPRAQYILGTAHFNGDVVPKDWVRAYALMTRAAASGLPQAGQSLAVMDQNIPIGERQQGIALAGEIEREAERTRNQAMAAAAVTAPVTPAGPASSRRPPRPMATTAVPPSNAAAEAAAAAAVSAASSPPTAGADFANPVPVQIGQTARPAARPPAAAAAASARVPAASAGGAWRIQLGAFSAQSRAESLWSSLETRYPDLASMQPFLVRAGAITRLQAGPFASKADADRACRALAGSVSGCISVRP